MVLPTGQIMFTDLSGLVEIYTPAAGVGTSKTPLITGPFVNRTHAPHEQRCEWVSASTV